ncbi:MAG: hypothetical protein K2K50_04260, partial [Anaeroplasmataceae bacterium]|nr:hypothetical protein [Anaeroplasmataceae bacterium]
SSLMEFSSSLFESNVQIKQMKQISSLDVNEKGIQGASATFTQISGSPLPKDCNDFVVDRSFGFIITDCNNIQLFSGVIYNI